MNKRHIVKITLFTLVSTVMLGSPGCSDELSSAGGKDSKIAGTWELTTESSRGTRTRTLTINEDFTGSYQGRNREFPVTDLKLEGDQLSFTIQMKWQDREFTMDFKGTVDGDSIKGAWTTSRGVREVTGKKI